MFDHVMDIHRMYIGDKITFDGNPAVFTSPGFVPTYGGASDHVIGVTRFVTTAAVSGINVGLMPFDGSTYEHDTDAYDLVFDDGTNGTTMLDEGGGIRSLEIDTVNFTEGEFYLVMIDSTGAPVSPISGSRTIENVSLIYVSHKALPGLGGAPAGVDVAAIKRLVSMMGAGVRIRDHTRENGYLSANEMAVFDYDNATLLSLNLSDINDDTYLDATYQAARVINQLGDEEQVTTTKD